MSASTLSIAPSNGRGLQLTSIDDVMRFARIVVTSGLAPKSFDTPEKVVIALVTGMELGISAMQSLQGLAVTNGRIGVMGDLALALCQASADFEDYQEDWLGAEGADDWGCRITVKRRNQTPKVGQFTVHDAKKARLWEKRGKDGAATPWITYPQRMLRYRALGFVLRDAFPDVLKGVKTVEELQDYPEESKNGFNHAKPVEGSVVEGEAKQPETSPDPKPNGNGNGHAPHANPADCQTITGIVERAWPNDYQGKRYYFAKVNGQQLQTTDATVGETLLAASGKAIRATVEPSPKPGKFYVKGVELAAPAAPEPPAPVVMENPGTDRVARRAAAKARHEAKAKPDHGDAIGMGGRTPYDELCERLASIRPALPEFWLLEAAKHLGWIPEQTHCLADLSPKALGVLLVRWSDLVRAARAEEHGAAETAAA
jgi:RecT family